MLVVFINVANSLESIQKKKLKQIIIMDLLELIMTELLTEHLLQLGTHWPI